MPPPVNKNQRVLPKPVIFDFQKADERIYEYNKRFADVMPIDGDTHMWNLLLTNLLSHAAGGNYALEV